MRELITDSAQADERQQIGNDPYNYTIEDVLIHDIFNPDGPPLAECLVMIVT